MSPTTNKLSTLVIAALAASTVAAPAPQTTNPVPAVRRSQCASKGATGHTQWAVYVVNTTMPSDQGSGSWGGGFLDNINGEFGCAPTAWQAVLDSAEPQGVACTFNTPLFCQTDRIVDAIHAASTEASDHTFGPGQWVYCEGDTLTDLFDGTWQIISSLTQELGAVADLLGAFAK
ncbi:MAG: hypothetical protein LQ338_005658 [Usnochroma carphineum]|nr:MAG: hypothetical protein LQ338_005658 [Usnochroma carphineum]